MYFSGIGDDYPIDFEGIGVAILFQVLNEE
jgi:hypothetical protein